MRVALLLGLMMMPAVQEKPVIGMQEGQMYPDFLLPTVDGKSGRLSDYRGKKVFLFNFASW